MVTGEERVLPLIVMAGDGAILDVVLTNQKGYVKSLEQNHLWFLHRETGRLLPYDGHTDFTRLTNRGDWCEAVVSPRDGGSGLKPEGDAGRFAASPENNSGKGEDFLQEEELSSVTGFLETLESLVLSRKQSLPEGSYTTHLFTSGSEKIRKKLGEEAVELLLARSRGDIVHESADLLYHLLIFLADCDISLQAVLFELESRHRL